MLEPVSALGLGPDTPTTCIVITVPFRLIVGYHSIRVFLDTCGFPDTRRGGLQRRPLFRRLIICQRQARFAGEEGAVQRAWAPTMAPAGSPAPEPPT